MITHFEQTVFCFSDVINWDCLYQLQSSSRCGARTVKVEILHTYHLDLKLKPKIWSLVDIGRDKNWQGGRQTCFDFYTRNILMSG